MRDPIIGYYILRLVQQCTTKGEVWTAQHPELMGCHAVAPTAREAISRLGEVRDEWLARADAAREPIPEPSPNQSYEIVFDPESEPADRHSAREAVVTEGMPTIWFPSEPATAGGSSGVPA